MSDRTKRKIEIRVKRKSKNETGRDDIMNKKSERRGTREREREAETGQMRLGPRN